LSVSRLRSSPARQLLQQQQQQQQGVSGSGSSSSSSSSAQAAYIGKFLGMLRCRQLLQEALNPAAAAAAAVSHLFFAWKLLSGSSLPHCWQKRYSPPAVPFTQRD
jgi:hypothetical protein